MGPNILPILIMNRDCRARFVINASRSSTSRSIGTGWWRFRSNRGNLFEHRGIVLRIDHAHILGSVVRDVPVAVPRMHVAHIVIAAPGTAAGQDALERFAELCIENRINDGVERGIGVAQPGEYLEGLAADAGLAECRHDVHAEEGNPAN